MFGPRHLSESVPNVAGQAFGRKYIMLGRLVTRWEDIVGKDMALQVQPAALKYRSAPPKKGDSKEAVAKAKKDATFTLEIAADSATATVLRYRADLILERINQIFGANWITAIRFVPKAAAAQSNNRFAKRVKPLTPAQKQSLSTLLDDITDPEIQATLNRLGQAILQDS